MVRGALCAAALLVSCALLAGEGAKVGDTIPSIKATSESGAELDLASFKGKSGVIVFFFPKAFTPGCTAESCGFRDEAAKFQAAGYTLIGASGDTPEVLKKFKEEYKLPYSLISDPTGSVKTALGLGAGKRVTAIIDKDGKIVKQITEVKAVSHPKDVQAELGIK